MSLAEPALYLEFRYDRAAILRVLSVKLRVLRQYAHPGQPHDRLTRRIERVERHLIALTGETP